MAVHDSLSYGKFLSIKKKEEEEEEEE